MAERPSELLPCPFCGSDDIRHWDAVYFETFCHDCGAAVRPEHKTPEGEAASIQAWNLCEGLRARAHVAAPAEPVPSDGSGVMVLNKEAQALLAECLAGHCKVLTYLVHGRSDLAIEEARKWTEGFMEAARISDERARELAKEGK